MSIGYIYCVSTPSNNDRCKVGQTLRGIESRLKGLNTTSVSENFKLDYYIIVNPKKRINIEKSIHNDITTAGYPRFPGKEFFKCQANDIKHIFKKYGDIYTIINEHKNVILEEEESNQNILLPKSSKLYKCNICKHEFHRKSILDNHLLRLNPCKVNDNINNKCLKCHKTYSKLSNLTKHIKICKKNIIIDNQPNINDQINISEIKKILLEQEKKILELAEINKTIYEKLFA